jgi:AAHS family 4-hydroxybenzoate transporter-like MFS transporter
LQQQERNTVPNPTLSQIIDGSPFGGFQLGVVGLCLLAQMVDGFDNQASAFVGPALAGHWHVARAAFGLVFSAGAFGTLVGSLVIGPLGDLFGRKALIVASLVAAALLMAATGSVSSMGQLTLVRFLTGLPLGALIPGTVVIANEWSPARGRTAMVTIMACGFALGAVLGGLLSSFLLPRFGWPAVFYAGAAGTATIAAAVLLMMPESLRFLSLRPSASNQGRIAAILRRFAPHLVDTSPAPGFASVPVGGVRLVGGLFAEGRAGTTLLLWAAFFMNLLALNFMTFWLPTLLAGHGVSQEAAIRNSTLFQLGGIAGVVLMGVFADAVGAWRQVAAGYLFAAGAVALVGVLPAAGRNVAIIVAGFCIIGVQMSLMALTATLYPTAVRSTGAAWAQGVGRLGSVTGPLVGGVLIGWHWSLPHLFGLISTVSVAGFVLALLLVRQARVAEPSAAFARA